MITIKPADAPENSIALPAEVSAGNANAPLANTDTTVDVSASLANADVTDDASVPLVKVGIAEGRSAPLSKTDVAADPSVAANTTEATANTTQNPANAVENPANATENIDGSGHEEHKKRIPLIWIPVTLSFGLLIAAVYLGGRIVAARRPAPPAVAAVTKPAIAVKPLANAVQPTDTPAATNQAGPAAANAVTTETSAQKPTPVEPAVSKDDTSDQEADAVPMIAPHSGERYLQVGALDLESTRRFVQRLRSQSFEPHVAPGPKPELLRVLIGPFDNREALNEKMAQLQSDGLESFIREY